RGRDRDDAGVSARRKMPARKMRRGSAPRLRIAQANRRDHHRPAACREIANVGCLRSARLNDRPTKAGTSDPMLPSPWRVRRTRRDTRDTFTLDLEPVNAGDGIQFLPGQFNMLYVFLRQDDGATDDPRA